MGRSGDQRRTLPCLAVVAAFLACAPASGASRPLALGFADGVFSPNSLDAPWYGKAKDAGAGFLEINMSWAATAPTRPSGDETDPANPDYSFWASDAVISAAAANGLSISLRVQGAPTWAEGEGKPEDVPDGAWRPDAAAFGRFATAVARRYSGTFEGLPRVRVFQAWGEANLTRYLAPQWTGPKNTPTSPGLYRRLLNAFYDGVKSVHRDNLVIAGGLAPFGDLPGGLRMPPAAFIRELVCVDDRLRAKRCSDPAHFDALAHHPYATGGPFSPALNPDDVSVPDLAKLTRPVRAAVRLGTVRPRRAKGLWVTEFSWDGNPPDPDGVPERRRARWVSEALYQFWRQGADHVVWFLLRDMEPRPSYAATYQSGFYTTDGEPKLGLRAFSFPFVVRGGRAWGRSPAAGRVTVERQVAGGWRRVASVQAGERAVFDVRVAGARRGVFRARVGEAESLSYRAG